MITYSGVRMSERAASVLEQFTDPSGIVADDLDKLRTGAMNAEQLLEHCLNGAEDSDTRACWSEYVQALKLSLTSRD